MQRRSAVVYFRRKCKLKRSKVRCVALFTAFFFMGLLCGIKLLSAFLLAVLAAFTVWYIVLKC